eukprot:1111943-Amorphochlora_amoeboformis.AAC.2
MVRTRCMVAFLAAVVNAGGLCTIVEVESSLYTGNVAGFNGTTTYRAAERAYGNNINCSFTVQAARLVFLDFCTGTGDFLMIDREFRSVPLGPYIPLILVTGAAGSGGSQMLEVFSGKNTLPEVQDSTYVGFLHMSVLSRSRFLELKPPVFALECVCWVS